MTVTKFLVPLVIILAIILTLRLTGAFEFLQAWSSVHTSGAPSFDESQATVVSFVNEREDEVYYYWFLHNGMVWCHKLNNQERWNREKSLPIILEEIVGRPAAYTQKSRNNTIGTVELQARDKQGMLWTLSADIRNTGELTMWRKTEISE